jgi:hypothetical protein
VRLGHRRRGIPPTLPRRTLEADDVAFEVSFLRQRFLRSVVGLLVRVRPADRRGLRDAREFDPKALTTATKPGRDIR